jgi:hypothetical protein
MISSFIWLEPFGFLVFLYSCYMHLLKSVCSLSIGSCSSFFLFFDNTHGFSFHFYLYSGKEENALHFENFEKSSFFFVYCNFVVQFQMCVEVYHQW